MNISSYAFMLTPLSEMHRLNVQALLNISETPISKQRDYLVSLDRENYKA